MSSYLCNGIVFDPRNSWVFLEKGELNALSEQVTSQHTRLRSASGPGSDFLGWLDPTSIFPPGELDRLKGCAARLRDSADILVVIGIGGSYLGARAVLEALGGDRAGDLLFAGCNLSAAYHSDVLSKMSGKRAALNVISKSGTTTEPAIAFRLLRDAVERESGPQAARNLIVATTDAAKGALRVLSTEEGYETFVVPDDIGGRYSVLSAVGLLPLAFAGIDIDALMQGAGDAAESLKEPNLDQNPAYAYAATRFALFRRGYLVEVLAHFEPRLRYVAEWWKQLFGESEGKCGTGLFPASMDLTADLHSMGQYMQQGRRILSETFLIVQGWEPDLRIPPHKSDLDGLRYLEGRSLAEVNHEAYRATSLAHTEGGVPNCTLALPMLDAYHLGTLLYFFELSCAMSGYLLSINPFDQPGVEAYKQHMFRLLGKPGYGKDTLELQNSQDDDDELRVAG